MYDACDYLRPPAGSDLVAGYVSGGCQWPPAAFTYWRHALVVKIATGATVDDGAVLDVERGDATPDQAPGWCARARLRGQIPTVYTSSANVQAVLDACKTHGVPAPQLWVANWSDGPVIPPGAIACQYDNDAARGFDLSVVADYWPGVDPAPTPIEPTEGLTVYVIIGPGDAGDYLLYPDGTLIPVSEVATIQSAQAAGFKTITIAAGDTEAWTAMQAKSARVNAAATT